MSVLIRRFESRDFSAAVDLFDEIWGWELEGDAAEKADLAVLYVAGIIAESNHLAVAEIDGAVCAVVFADVVGLGEVEERSAYLTMAAQAQARLQMSETGRRTLAFYAKLEAVFAGLCEAMLEAGDGWDAEIKLLLTSSACRGRGIATRLTQTVFEALSKNAGSRCMLCTDTHCSWQYYEKTGWRRAAQIDWNDGSGITAFAYRKEV